VELKFKAGVGGDAHAQRLQSDLVELKLVSVNSAAVASFGFNRTLWN